MAVVGKRSAASRRASPSSYGTILSAGLTSPRFTRSVPSAHESRSLGVCHGQRAMVLSALLALFATLLPVQPASAQEEDPCANPPPGAIVGTAANDVLRGTPGTDFIVAGDGNDMVITAPVTTSSWPARATTSSTAAPATTVSSAVRTATCSTTDQVTTSWSATSPATPPRTGCRPPSTRLAISTPASAPAGPTRP